VAEWELSPQWAHWFNLREGQRCPSCAANLRSGHLAQTLTTTLNRKFQMAANTLKALVEEPKLHGIRIAEINSAGALHPFLACCPHLCYSEFGSTSPDIPSEDLLNLTYPDSTFDLVITAETLEHVPDIDQALRQIHRVLKPGAMHIFTAPVVWDRPATRQRAQLQRGELVHLFPPSFHGGPNLRKSDFLVFYEFGADFVDRCEAAGFKVELLRDEQNRALATFITTKV
jgi:SAM-dependent methyltransferase